MLTDVALLILRLVAGLMMAAHGAQKVFGWFNGPGMKNYTGWIEGMHLRPARLWAWISALSELSAGVLLALGVLTPLAAAVIIGVMLMAIATVHIEKGFWNTRGGYEFNVLIIAVALALGLAGPGAYALEPAIFASLPRLEVFGISLVVVLVGVAAGLLIGERAPQTTMKTR